MGPEKKGFVLELSICGAIIVQIVAAVSWLIAEICLLMVKRTESVAIGERLSLGAVTRRWAEISACWVDQALVVEKTGSQEKFITRGSMQGGQMFPVYPYLERNLSDQMAFSVLPLFRYHDRRRRPKLWCF